MSSDKMSLALATTPLLCGVTDHSWETIFLEAKLQGVKDYSGQWKKGCTWVQDGFLYLSVGIF